MKTILLGLAYSSLFLSLVSAFFVAIDFQPLFAGKFSFNNVFAFALISIAASGVWLCFNEQEKNERLK